MKKVWCKHITRFDAVVDGDRRYSWWMSRCQVLKSWKVCPICEAPRPKSRTLTFR